MTYSFLLVNFNMWGLVERCVREIETHIGEHNGYEILIADNSTDVRFAAPEEFARDNPRVRVTRVPANRGWIDALNRILPQVAGQFIVIMHPDVTLDENCVPSLREFLKSHPRAGVVAPSLSYPDGTPNTIRLQIPRVSVELRRLINIASHIVLKRRLVRDETLWDHRADVQAETLMSVLMMFRREVLAQIEPVEPRLWSYYANDWMCGRARQRGWTCHYVVGAKAVHWERYSPASLYSDSKNSAYKRSPVPVSDRMNRDRFTFLRAFHSFPRLTAFRMLATAEFLIHILAQLKPGRTERRESIGKFAATVKAAWA
jgi:GT2 family glycosyltransferase